MDSPVFNDASGARLSAIQWGGRILLALVVLLGTALALTLRSHVSVPGLERLMPGLEAKQVRPVVRTEPSKPPAKPADVRTRSSFQPRPTTQPTTGRAGMPTPDAVPSDARREVGPTTKPTSGPTLRPTAGPTASVSPTGSASPTTSAVGEGTVKPRNPKAATPSPPKQQAPGQSRTPKPKPITDVS